MKSLKNFSHPFGMTDDVFFCTILHGAPGSASLLPSPAYPAIKERIDYGQLGGVETTYSNKD